MSFPSWRLFARTLAYRVLVFALLFGQILVPAGDAMASSAAPDIKSFTEIVEQEPEGDTVSAPESEAAILQDSTPEPPAPLVPSPDIPASGPGAHLLLAGDEKVTVGGNFTLQAVVANMADNDVAVEGLVLALTLPSELLLVEGAASVGLNALTPKTVYTHTWHLTTAPYITEAAAVNVTVGLGRVGTTPDYEERLIAIYPAETSSPLNGRIADNAGMEMVEVQGASGTAMLSPSGLIEIVVPAESAEFGTQFQIDVLYESAVEVAPELPAELPMEPVLDNIAPAPPEGGTIPPLPATAEPTIVSEPQPIPDSVVADAPAPESAIPSEETLFFEEYGLPTLVDDGVNFFAQWEMRAIAPGGNSADRASDVHEFENGIQMRLDISHLVDAGVPPEDLRIWTRESTEEVWKTLEHVRYDAETKSISVWTYHFSLFGLGKGLEATGDRLPSIKAFSVDELTGAATIQVPIEAPTGLGGMAPQVSLSYSSAIMDDWRRIAQNKLYVPVRGGSAGASWNVSGISYIARTDDNFNQNTSESAKTFAMVLNGQSVSLIYRDGKWRTNPEIFADVQWTGSGSRLSGTAPYGAYDWNYWSVTLADGTRYEFGELAAFNSNQSTTYNQTKIHRVSAGSSNYYRLTQRWYLRKVINTVEYVSGTPVMNTMFYTYKSEYSTFTEGLPAGWTSGGHNWYIRTIDPTGIYWSSHDAIAASGDIPYKLRMSFEYSPNSRQDSPTSFTASSQPSFPTHNQLVSIAVAADVGTTPGTPSWTPIRSYVLGQQLVQFEITGGGTEQKRYVLSSIKVQGKTENVERTYTFQYNTHLNEANNLLIEHVADSWGGSVTYLMQTVTISCSNAVCGGGADGKYRWTMFKHTANDGMGEPDADGDGLTNSQVLTRYQYTPDGGGAMWGAVDDEGGFQGFKQAIVFHYDRGSSSVLLKKRVLLSYAEGTGGSRENPDPRWGRLKEEQIYNAGGTLLAKTSYDLKAYWFQAGAWSWTPRTTSWTGSSSDKVFPPTWIRQEAVVSTVSLAVKVKRFVYSTNTGVDSQFGNVIAVEEDNDIDSGNGYLRRTETIFTPNTAVDSIPGYIVNLPSRVTVLKSGGVCVAETRYVYGKGRENATYLDAPTTVHLAKTERLLSSTANCWAGAPVGKYDLLWEITHYQYDDWGNQKKQIRLGSASDGSQDIGFTTDYDPVYHVFPVSQYYDSANTYKETARYYGVANGINANTANAFWGQMQSWCGVNNVCTWQAYDDLGRKSGRWMNRSGAMTSIPAITSADTRWYYYAPKALLDTQKTFVVVTWNKPRCVGNFTRSHYNGMGQLVATQTPYQDWVEPGADETTCSGLSRGQEIHTNYRYDGLGRLKQTSIPESKARSAWTTVPPTTWPAGTSTTYDALDRTDYVTAPNEVVTNYSYGAVATGYQTAIFTDLANFANDRMVSWTQTNLLGQRSVVKTYNNTGAAWVENAAIHITNDAMGNVTVVDHPDLTANTTMTYDKAGRKLGMTDPDLGAWTYAYDRQGRLTAQRDAKGNVTCLYYDNMERLIAKVLATGALTSCSATPPTATTAGVIFYTYGTSGTAKGQVTAIRRNDPGSSTAWYTHAFTYNPNGLLLTETKTIQSATASPASYAATLTYGYDTWFRPSTVTYPDGEIVTTSYNSMGLPSGLTSSIQGTLVSNVTYDVAGRLTEMQLAAWGDLWRRNVYYSFTNANGGRLASIRLGTQAAPTASWYLQYTWDAYGNVASAQNNENWEYLYDNQQRLTGRKIFGQSVPLDESYAYRADGFITSFDGSERTVDAVHGHGLDMIKVGENFENAYDYDATGNVTKRIVAGQTQTLTWTRANELSTITVGSGQQTYLYDADGMRIRKHMKTGSTFNWHVYEFFPQYELRVEGSTTTATRYYFFGGQRIAQKAGTVALTYLHTDMLGSTVRTVTAADGTTGGKRYTSYGATHSGSIPTDKTYTGQEDDGTELLYYGARYYDPRTGQFMSPDTIVPDPNNLFDYNRYLYVRGNPLRFTDPTGHFTDQEIMTHYGCETWACIQAIFAEGGILAGMGGWLYILMAARDDDSVGIYTTTGGYGASQANHINGTIQIVDGRISVGNVNAYLGQTSTPLLDWDSLSGDSFAILAHLNQNTNTFGDFYTLNGSKAEAAGINERRVDCKHNDCVSDTINAISTGSSAVALTCTTMGLAPCAGAAAAVSRVSGIASVGWTTYGVVSGKTSAVSGAVSVGLWKAGSNAGPKADLAINITGWIWDHVTGGE